MTTILCKVDSAYPKMMNGWVRLQANPQLNLKVVVPKAVGDDCQIEDESERTSYTVSADEFSFYRGTEPYRETVDDGPQRHALVRASTPAERSRVLYGIKELEHDRFHSMTPNPCLQRKGP